MSNNNLCEAQETYDSYQAGFHNGRMSAINTCDRCDVCRREQIEQQVAVFVKDGADRGLVLEEMRKSIWDNVSESERTLCLVEAMLCEMKETVK